MSESMENLHGMGLPAAVLQALVPRSKALAPPEPKHTVAAAVDRFEHAEPRPEPEHVVTELRGLAELHQARQAAATADETPKAA